MKLKTLKIQNIASIEEAFIPFDQAPLASEPLFLITGDTGSGKSTILNCICLALYQTTPNLDNYGTPSEKTFDGLGTNSPVQMMRRGSDNASVELTFEANNGKFYKATWAVKKPKRRGDVQNYTTSAILEHLKIDSGEKAEPTLTRLTEIRQRIPELVGFNLDQFTRTTLLAQGQFSKFLYAKGNEKTSILEKLTGTELFAQIGMEIFRLSKEAEKEHEILEGKVKSIHLLNEEEKQQLEDEITRLKEEQVLLTDKINQISKQADWITHKQQKQQALKQKQEQLKIIQEHVASEGFALEKRMLQQWDFTHTVRNEMFTAEQQSKLYESLRQQILSLQQKYTYLIEGLRYLEETHKKTTEEHAKLEALLLEQRPNEEMYLAAGEISRLNQNLRDRKNQIRSLKSQIQLQLENLELSQAKETVLKEKAEKALDAFQNQERITEAQRQLCQGLDQKALSAAYSQLVDLENKLQQAVKDIEDYRQKLNDLKYVEQTLEEARKNIQRHTSELEEAEANIPLLENEYKIAKAHFEGSLKLQDQLNLIRNFYADHQECPLCGTKGVTLHTDEQLEQNKLQAQQAQQNAEKRLNELKDKISRLNSTLLVLTKDAKAKETEYVKRKQLFDKAKRNVEIDSQVLSFDYGDPEAISKLTQRITKTGEEKTTKKAEFDKAVELINKAAEETKRLEIARKQKEKAEKELQSQQDQTKKLQSEIELNRNSLEQNTKEAENTLNNVKKLIKLPEGFEEVTYENLPKLSQIITQEAQIYKDRQKQAEELHRTIEKLGTEIETSKKNLEPLSTRYTTPTEVIPRLVRDLSGSITQLNNQVNSLEGKMAQSRELYKENQEQVTKWLEQNPEYTLDALKQLQQMTGEEAQTLRIKISTSLEKQAASLEAYNTVKNELDKWMLERPQIQESIVKDLLDANGIINGIIGEEDHFKEDILEATEEKEGNEDNQDNEATTLEKPQDRVFALVDLLSKEAINKAAEEERKRLDETIKVKAQDEAKLKQDQLEALRVAKDMEKLAELEKIKNDWQILSRKFGGSDGKAFREIAQSYVLRLLLQQANYYLNKLSPRYELACDDGSLTINIIDKFQSGSVRNVTSLSGGESFVVSLALALGLSAINPQKINVDILFIDEGFGTLDKEFLDTVITSLDQLHMINGRRIGLISHVDTLKERIQTQIQVTRSGSSSSKIKIVPEKSES